MTHLGTGLIEGKFLEKDSVTGFASNELPMGSNSLSGLLLILQPNLILFVVGVDSLNANVLIFGGCTRLKPLLTALA